VGESLKKCCDIQAGFKARFLRIVILSSFRVRHLDVKEAIRAKKDAFKQGSL